MAGKLTHQGKIIIEMIEKFPQLPTLTLGKMLLSEHPLLFKDVEHARKRVQYFRGETGQDMRNKSTYFREHGKPNKMDVVKPSLPESFGNNEKKIFKLPIGDNNILMISDLHLPYHSTTAVELALQYGIDNNVNTIFINGDLLDFHNESRFETDPKKRSTREEFEACKQFFEYVRYLFPKVRIYWLKGNHDKRYEHWLMTKAPQLFGDSYYLLEERLSLNNYGVTLIDDAYLVKIGKLSVTHGHLLLRGVFAPVNAARGVFMRAKESCIIGHVHKVSEHQETDIDGKVMVTYSTGCLCEIYPDYAPMSNNYMHGFAHIRVEPTGEYYVQNKKIINGKIY